MMEAETERERRKKVSQRDWPLSNCQKYSPPLALDHALKTIELKESLELVSVEPGDFCCAIWLMVQNCIYTQAFLGGATETTERVPYFDDVGLG